MKTLLSIGTLVLATPAMTISASAGCIPVPGYCLSRPTVPVHDLVKPPHPQSRKKKAHRPAPTHHVAKRPQQPQPKKKPPPEEKAPPAGTPPALPPR